MLHLIMNGIVVAVSVLIVNATCIIMLLSLMTVLTYMGEILPASLTTYDTSIKPSPDTQTKSDD